MENDHRQRDDDARRDSDENAFDPCVGTLSDQADVSEERDRKGNDGWDPEQAQPECDAGVLRDVGQDVADGHGDGRGRGHARREPLPGKLPQSLARDGPEAPGSFLNEEQGYGQGDEEPDEFVAIARSRSERCEDAGGIHVGDHDEPRRTASPSSGRPQVAREGGKVQVPAGGGGLVRGT